jgi:hypothetical protein
MRCRPPSPHKLQLLPVRQQAALETQAQKPPDGLPAPLAVASLVLNVNLSVAPRRKKLSHPSVPD